jgi:hypothetical protein
MLDSIAILDQSPRAQERKWSRHDSLWQGNDELRWVKRAIMGQNLIVCPRN